MSSQASSPFRVRVVRNFWRRAQEARTRYETLMAKTYGAPEPDARQIWDYWYVPEQYFYLRTLPRRVIGQDLVDDFMSTLTRYCETHLGDLRPDAPWMTMHTEGMRLELHDDAINGRLAYVFSLTPEPLRFSGGETCILRAGPPEPDQDHHHRIKPIFNQLLLFDDTAPHWVPVVQDVRDPLHARLCLTGHIR